MSSQNTPHPIFSGDRFKAKGTTKVRTVKHFFQTGTPETFQSLDKLSQHFRGNFDAELQDTQGFKFSVWECAKVN